VFAKGGLVRLMWAGVFLVMLSGCYEKNPTLVGTQPAQTHEFSQKVKELALNQYLDIFWVIGGMTEQAGNFRSGIEQFMTDFVKKKFDYRMAVVSSNVEQKPFLGMPKVFDQTDLDPVKTLTQAVYNATNGYDREMVFDPIVHYLSLYPQFNRSDAFLAVILTNDDRDSSTKTTKAADVLDFLAKLKGGDKNKVIVYGIFGATDLNCAVGTIDSDWNYKGTEFETLINSTGGTVYSLCDASFGTQLAKLGDNLYKHINHGRIILPTRPELSTLKVYFHDKELPPGPGGVWNYDVDTNSVVFSSLDFAQQDTEQVVVRYEEFRPTKP
jgi:hypothetical protein